MAIHSQGSHSSSEGAYALAGGGRDSQSGPHPYLLPDAQVRRVVLFVGFSLQRDSVQGQDVSLHLSQSLVAKYLLLPLSAYH